MNNFFCGKKVCLLCCGSSLENKKVDCKSYDLVCGTNRIYKTSYFNQIDVLFDGSHYIFDPFDDHKISILNASDKLKLIVFSCGFRSYETIERNSHKLKKRFILKYRDGALERTTKRSIGTESFLTIINHTPSLLDVFGMDFHKSSYMSELQSDTTHANPAGLHDYDAEEFLCKSTAECFNSLHPGSIVIH